jgi:hypothetical protein
MPSCCVVSCTSTRNLHIFPRDKRLKQLWIEACGRSSDWIPRPDERMCSSHFSSLDVTITRRVKEGAVPRSLGRYFILLLAV